MNYIFDNKSYSISNRTKDDFGCLFITDNVLTSASVDTYYGEELQGGIVGDSEA